MLSYVSWDLQTPYIFPQLTVVILSMQLQHSMRLSIAGHGISHTICPANGQCFLPDPSWCTCHLLLYIGLPSAWTSKPPMMPWTPDVLPGQHALRSCHVAAMWRAWVRRLQAIAGSPELYPELIRLGGLPHILALLSHDNSDIAASAIQLLRELTDADAIEDSVRTFGFATPAHTVLAPPC